MTPFRPGCINSSRGRLQCKRKWGTSMRWCIFFAGLSVMASSAFAGGVDFGPEIGIYIPTGQYADLYTASPEFGAHVTIDFGPAAAEAGVTYVPLGENGDYQGYELFDDYKAFVIPIRIGARKSFGVMNVGLGLMISSFNESVDMDGISLDNSSSGSGFWGQLGAGFPVGTVKVGSLLRAQTVNFLGMGTEVAVSVMATADF